MYDIKLYQLNYEISISDFKTLYSNGQTFGEIPLENKLQILEQNTSHAYISFSVKTKKNAQIVLSYKERFQHNWSYLISISSLDDDKTTIVRKCPKGMPGGEPEDEECKKVRAKVTHPNVR